MNAPQIIYVCLLALSVGVSLAKNGEPQGNYSIWASLISTTLAVGLLFWGGFFG